MSGKRGAVNQNSKAFHRLLSLPYVQEIDGKAYVRVPYKNAAGNWRSRYKRVNTESEAIAEIAKLQAAGTTPDEVDGARMTFDALLKTYRKTNKKLRDYYAKPLEFFNGRKIRSISYDDCKRFRESREQVQRWARVDGQRVLVDRKPSTINREVEALRRVLLYALRQGWILRNPFSAGPPLIRLSEEESRDRFPTPDEEARLLAQCVGPRAHLRGLIIAARDTGLRRAALRSLDWSFVDWEQRLICVPTGNKYKRRPRFVGLSARLYGELRVMWEAAERPASGKIFFGGDFKHSFATACQKAGIVDLHFHDLRHGFATDLMESDVSKRLAMRVTGHTSERVHDIYTNIDERLARQIADSLDRLHVARSGGDSQKTHNAITKSGDFEAMEAAA